MGPRRPYRLGSPRRLASALAAVLLLLAPAAALAHPLGNFTINHYAGLRVEPGLVRLDVVIDQAEIPAFQARLAFDTDEDGSVSDEEVADGRVTACADLTASLALAADGIGLSLTSTHAGLSFPLGSTGLSTLRLVCGFVAELPAPLAAETPTTLTFRDSSYAERLGWREIVVTGSGTTVRVVEGKPRAASPSARLTAYPEDLVAQPLADASVVIEAVAGGVDLGAWVIPDAEPVDDAGAPAPAVVPSPVATAAPTAAPTDAAAASPAPAAVPGGIDGDFPSIFRATDLTPLVLLLSVLTAVALGAGHALTPGHGKTLMAAYLVGTRGTPLHALGLGLSVSVSHTVGILILGALVVGVADVLPPDLVVGAAPIVAAVSIVVIGAWMLTGEIRRRRATAVARRVPGGAHAAGHGHEHEHGHGHGLAGSTISWRGLFALGLAGGLIPSTSALLILLGAIAAGRPGFGLILVVAFGSGMAAVMAGVGLVVVVAHGRLEGVSDGGNLGRVRDAVPLVAAVLVVGFGIYLTAQALVGAPTL